MKNFTQFFKTTFILATILLLGGGNVWAFEFTRVSKTMGQEVSEKKSWSANGNHCTFIIDGNSMENSGNNIKLTKPKGTYYLHWKVDNGYTIKVTAASVYFGKDGTASGSAKFGGSVVTKAGWVNLNDLELSNSDKIEIWSDGETFMWAQQYWYIEQLKITYTITPDAPTIVNGKNEQECYTEVVGGEGQTIDLKTVFTHPGASYVAYEYQCTSTNASNATISNGVFSASKIGSYTVQSRISANANCHETSEWSEVCTINVVDRPRKEVAILVNPTAAIITYLQPLSASTLTGGEATVEGTWTWKTPELILNAGSHKQTVIFTPTGSEFTADDKRECNVDVVVNKANPIVSCTMAGACLVGDASINLSTLWTSTGDGAITYAIESFNPSGSNNEGATAPSLAGDGMTLSLGQAGLLTISMTQSEGDNYIAVSKQTMDITISKHDSQLAQRFTAVSGNKVVSLLALYSTLSNQDVIISSNDETMAKVLNGEIYFYNKVGTVQFAVSQAENYYWEGAEAVFSVAISAAATSQWNPETPAAGEFYLLNSKYNNQDNFLKATSVITTNPAEATKFTFTSATSSPISYIENGETRYVAQSSGNQVWGTTQYTWTITASNSDDQSKYGQGAGWKLVNKNGDNYERHIAINNQGGVNYIRQNWGNYSYVWSFISAAQMNAYLAYNKLSEYVSSKTVSVSLKDKAVETLSANGFDSETAFATKVSNLQAVIEAYDAYAEVKAFLDNQPASEEKTAALAALDVATTTETIYAAKRMIEFPLTLVAQNTDGYWATFSCGYDVEFVEGVTVYTVNVSGEDMHLLEVVDRQVPANTGVLIKSTNTAISYVAVAPVAALEDNMLQPGTGGMTEGDNCRFYRLAYYDYAAKTGLGFYYGSGCDDGQAFKCKAGTAYLAVPKDMVSGNAPARFLLGRQDVSTEIENIIIDNTSTNSSLADGKKVMMNGVLYIIRDGKTYDSFGRMVK